MPEEVVFGTSRPESSSSGMLFPGAKPTEVNSGIDDPLRQEQASEPLHHRLHRHIKKHHSDWSPSNLFGFFVHSVVIVVLAYFYQQKRQSDIPQARDPELDPELGRNVFAFGLFDEKESWGNDFWFCLCAAGCLPIQWAETMTDQKTQVLERYWPALALGLLHLTSLADFSYGLSYLLFVFFAVRCRQRLREKFGLSAGTPETYAQDAIVWCCCSCCAAVQEARQVAYVRLASERRPNLTIAGEVVQEESAGYVPTDTESERAGQRLLYPQGRQGGDGL